jgi:hypothetical protein
MHNMSVYGEDEEGRREENGCEIRLKKCEHSF